MQFDASRPLYVSKSDLIPVLQIIMHNRILCRLRRVGEADEL